MRLACITDEILLSFDKTLNEKVNQNYTKSQFLLNQVKYLFRDLFLRPSVITTLCFFVLSELFFDW